MMRSSNPAASMQKTYDDCYLVCSTAIYFEKQNNEEEALRSWREALDQIYYHNAYKIAANYRPKTETEKALQESLRSMELQCKERVDLLESLRKSRLEARSRSPLVANGKISKSVGPSRTNSNDSGGLGYGTVPAANYSDIARPIPVRLPSSTKPGVISRQITEPMRSNSIPQLSNDPRRVASASTMLPPQRPGTSRSPSPDKKLSFKSSLRPGTKEPSRFVATMRPKAPAIPAAKAASMAWPGSHAPDGVTTNGSRNASMDHIRTEHGHGSHNNYPRPPSANEVMPPRVSMSNDLPLRPKSHDPQRAMVPPHSKLQLRSDVDRWSKSNSSQPTSPTFPSYRSEYPTPTPINPHRIAGLLSSRRNKVDVDSARSEPKKEPTSPRKIASGVFRKAVGSGPSKVANQQPQSSNGDGAPRKSMDPGFKKSMESSPKKSMDAGPKKSMDAGAKKSMEANPAKKTKPQTEEPILADLPPEKSTEPPTEAMLWDARVAYLMKHLPRGVDEQAAKSIFNEIVIHGDEVHWDDVAGLDIAKTALKEAVVYPFLRPDLFMGLREPARGMLLFGPPGTGKTMLARAVATESKSTFFAISASSLTSKYLGESEKLVRALFTLAKALTPAIIFVDEIDSLLSARAGSGEHEATRRIKTEFLIQWSDLARAAAGKEQTEGDASRVLVLAATNMPWAIDDAARRRFVRRQYIPLPEAHVRGNQLRKLMSAQRHALKDKDFTKLVALTDGFSGSDITALAKDAAMGPLRALGERLLNMSPDQIRPISLEDFQASLINIRPSVSKQGLKEYESWAKEFGERAG